MPTITAAETAIVAAALLLVYVAPVVLTLLEGSRRRQAQPWAHSPLDAGAAPVAALGVSEAASTAAATGSDIPSGAPAEAVAPPLGVPESEATSTTTPLREPMMAPQGTPAALPPPSAGLALPAAAERGEFAAPPRDAAPPPGATADAAGFAGYEPASATPFHGPEGYRFRMDDLHRVRLADWPPNSVHRDPARQDLWSAGTRLAAAHDAAIAATDLLAPCPVRSVCLGACERRATGLALHFLLFPDLWPVGPEQAVARAVFAVDTGSGALRHSVDVLHPSV